ncbi:hypothetical protein RHMOL_Rhmol06G0142000 [Rhododendron molle]|uniref:Uncharacterized protein n=1 Tax=Rhododendron molle TaxID=49168 RepID=A0ACC0NDK5_RHOML|nr:hypothetical protein RHMOL_Rhmol06G0142000 [Rhododendron molle]
MYLQALDKLVLPRKLFRGTTRISAALPPSQATKPQEIPQFPQEQGHDLRRLSPFTKSFPGPAFKPKRNSGRALAT